MEPQAAFAQNFLVVGLPAEVIQQIYDLAKIEVYGSADKLIRTGEASGDLFVVLEGNAHVVTDDENYIATAGPGSLIGEVSLVDAQPRSADVVARGHVKVARLPASDLRRFMAQNKDAGFMMLANLCRVLSMRLRNATVELDELKDKAKDDPWNMAVG